MQREIRLSLENASELIDNADIILFNSPTFPKVGWWVARYTLNRYSHVALALRKDNQIYCLEMREFKGGRIYPLSNYIVDGYSVDIFRTSQKLKIPYLDSPPIINGEKPKIVYQDLDFTDDIKERILQDAFEIIDNKYGYINIVKIFLTFIPFIRLFTSKDSPQKHPKSFVCSTLVDFCYYKNWIDLCYGINSSYVTPADISNSSILNYLFTIDNL